ncbi:HNH endonuclease [Streptomyces sp. NPDC057293]|uniref:HNH endonuclease n=1 Tax=unclassified Streptomyces TaxID=2593676 RepID=UPI0036323389
MDKLCRRCETVKAITEFCKDKSKKSGYGSYCKPCSSEIAKAWQRNNPEKRKARDTAWYAQNKERKAATGSKRRPAYRERRRELDRSRYAGMTEEQRRKRWNDWYEANREHWNHYRRARNVIRRSQGADWQNFADSLEYVLIIANDPCVYCGAPAKSVDHVVPVARGGSGEWTNLAPACLSCNSSKCDEPLLAFLLRTRGTRMS